MKHGRSSAARGGARSRGFTLIEMVVTVALVGILASALLPVTELTMQRTREQELRVALRQIRSAIDAYKVAVDEGRIARQADTTGYPPGLALLADGAEDIRQPGHVKIRFLRRLPRDPLNPDPAVPAAEIWGKRSYASPPDEPREGADVFDVYTRAEGVGLNGVPYKEW
jgi:general secretion pathway protein G